MPTFSEGAIWRAAPEIATPTEPHSPRREEIDGFSFRQLIASAVKVHENLHNRSLDLQAENGRLQMELALLRQSVYLATPRPDTKPEALSPRLPEVISPRFNGASGEEEGSYNVNEEFKRVRISKVTEISTDYEQGTFKREISHRSVSPSDDSGTRVVGSSVSSLLEPCSPRSMISLRSDRDYGQEKSKSQVSRTMSEVQKSDIKKQHELRRKFMRMDREGTGQVQSEWLEELMAKHNMTKSHSMGRRPSRGNSERRPSISSAVSERDDLPSCLAVIQAVSGYLGCEESVMTYQTFAALMTKEDLQYFVTPEIWEKIVLIRAMFAKEEMTKMVARYSHVDTEDLSAFDHDYTAWYLRYLDPVSLTAIFLNALMLGLSSDIYSNWTGWDICEFFFTAFFLLELVLKVRLEGYDIFLFGKDAWWNWLDAVIVFIAVVDAILNVMAETSNMQLFTMMRLVRLARITRLVRLLRFKFFKELLLMIRGVFAGMRTLLWAIVLLSLYIFMLGMLMRQTMGRWCDPEEWKEDREFCTQEQLEKHGAILFSTLPRSCLTVFRCLTDGCSDPDGTPLVIHIFEDSDVGPIMVVIYVFSFLFVTFGLFNLIMAIFVENTMESAKYDERKRQRMRQMQAVHVAEKLQRLVLRFGKASHSVAATPSEIIQEQGLKGKVRWLCDFFRGRSQDENSEADILPVGLDMEISRDTFSKVVADPSVEKLLDDLEVAVADPMDLFDTLDADGSGSIDVSELIKGLMKLRGTAEKSDVVACLLAVRAIQKSLSGFEVKIMQSNKNMIAGQDKMDSQVRLLDKCLQKVVPGYGEQLKILKEEVAAKNAARAGHGQAQPRSTKESG